MQGRAGAARGHAAALEDLLSFDDVVIATGVVPRAISFPGSNDPRVLSYIDVLRNKACCSLLSALVSRF